MPKLHLSVIVLIERIRHDSNFCFGNANLYEIDVECHDVPYPKFLNPKLMPGTAVTSLYKKKAKHDNDKFEGSRIISSNVKPGISTIDEKYQKHGLKPGEERRKILKVFVVSSCE